jgi:hypothetical protein
MPDFYPKSMDDKPAWHLAFANQMVALGGKYNISPADQISANQDWEWMQWVVTQRQALNTFNQQVTKYFNDIAGNDPTKDPPEPLTFTLTVPPKQVAPGVEFRTREWARQVKGTTIYSEADGEGFGIVPGDSAISLNAPTIDVFAAESLYHFSVVVTGRGGADQWECLVRPVGATAWKSLGSKTGKSSDFTYVPDAASQADEPTPVQLQVRVQLKKNNFDMNPPSDIKIVTVNP